MEEAVTFQNKNNKKLFGIVHIPENSPFEKKKIGVNLLNPGIKYRVAPNRLNVKLARKLCQKGYYVLRFDPEGIGDSEGELPENLLVPEIGEIIQTGHFVEDTISANNFFVEKYRIDKLILIGNCGGAITALIASAKDESSDALCLIDVPINLRQSKMTFADKTVVGGKRANWLFLAYFKKLFSLKSWYRFISLQTDYRALYKILYMKVQAKLFLSNKENRTYHNIEKLCHKNGLNRLFFESFETFIENNRPILFVLAGNDPGTEIFQLYFQNGYLQERRQNEGCDELIEIFLVENANHIYTLTEWQESLLNKILNWIDTQNIFRDLSQQREC